MEMMLLLLLSVLLLRGKAVSHGHHSNSRDENITQPPEQIFNSSEHAQIKSSSNYETSPDDIDGLKALANQFSLLQLSLDFGGDPCGEGTSYYWTWIECSTSSTPPRIIALNLANNDLYGELPDFSQMQALETIDFANNMLYGPIPSFLGQFPNLKRLDLSNNQFRGNIPGSILDKKNLTYNVEGNPNVHRPTKKNLGLFIGLPLGLVFGLFFLPGLLIFLLIGRKTPPRPSQVMIGTAAVNVTGSSQGISQEQLNNPSLPSSSQGFDQVEVNELLQLHNSMNNSRRG